MPKPIHSSTSIADLHRAIYAMQDYNELSVSAQSVPTALIQRYRSLARSLASRKGIFRNADFSAATQASLACNAGHGWPQRGRLVTCPTRIHAPRCIGPCAGTCISPLDKLEHTSPLSLGLSKPQAKPATHGRIVRRCVLSS